MDIEPLYDDAASMDAEDPLERLRSICLAMPEATERLSHGEPTWFVRGNKTFVTFADHHQDDRLAFWCAAPDGVQAEMVSAEPNRFFAPPYVGVRGWLGVRLDISMTGTRLRDSRGGLRARGTPQARCPSRSNG